MGNWCVTVKEAWLNRVRRAGYRGEVRYYAYVVGGSERDAVTAGVHNLSEVNEGRGCSEPITPDDVHVYPETDDDKIRSAEKWKPVAVTYIQEVRHA